MCTSFNDRQTGLNPTVHLSLGLFIENERAKKKGGEKSREEREREVDSSAMLSVTRRRPSRLTAWIGGIKLRRCTLTRSIETRRSISSPTTIRPRFRIVN